MNVTCLNCGRPQNLRLNGSIVFVAPNTIKIETLCHCGTKRVIHAKVASNEIRDGYGTVLYAGKELK